MNFWTMTLITWTTVATTRVIGSTARQWVRMVATAPSRISPSPRGRSGITPGLAAGAGPTGRGRPGSRSGGRTGPPAGCPAAVPSPWWAGAAPAGPRAWCPGSTTARAAAARRTTSGRRMGGAGRADGEGCCAPPSVPGRSPSDGEDPGVAQPGESFIVTPSCAPAAAGRWSLPSCHVGGPNGVGGGRRIGCGGGAGRVVPG